MSDKEKWSDFVEIATGNLVYQIQLRFDVMPQKYRERLARQLIRWLETHLTKRAADECWAVRKNHMLDSWKFCPFCGVSTSTHR